MAVTMNITVFWDVVPCNIFLCSPYGSSRFSEMFVNFQHTHGITSKKMVRITVFLLRHTYHQPVYDKFKTGHLQCEVCSFFTLW